LEQEFVARYSARLPNVKIIKTSGGLFDFIAGAKSRAPRWLQKAGFEWAYRLLLEPKRLAVRYLTTNPVALMMLLTQTR
jgi:exopolysaccharide biosynthesis WecB/TagA/CpsF family protein